MKNTFDLRTFLAENKTHAATVAENEEVFVKEQEVEEGEYFGPDGDSIIEIIKDRSRNNDSSEIDEAMEVMEFIGLHYGIDFDFGRHSMEEAEVNEEEVEESAPGFEHDCAAHVVHETYGFGVCIEGQHTLVETAEGKGEVTHYDVFFKKGGEVKNIPVNELKIMTSESHTHGKSKKKNEEVREEQLREQVRKILGDE